MSKTIRTYLEDQGGDQAEQVAKTWHLISEHFERKNLKRKNELQGGERESAAKGIKTEEDCNKEDSKQEAVVNKGQSSDSNKDQQIETENEGDKVRRTVKSNLNYWYGPYFIANGYQSISNDEEGRRSVFYLNKIEFKP